MVTPVDGRVIRYTARGEERLGRLQIVPADLEGVVALAERVAHVHHRKGEACDRCGDVIREVSYNAYAVNYCATCQTGGKILADNTTSKFLK